MGNLFDLIEPAAQLPVVNDTWRPPNPPSLDGIDEIYLNFETTGLRWFERDKPLSVSLRAGGKSYYLPWAHSGGGNLDEGVVKEWAKRELRGKLITNINTRFDIHMARVWGVDLEEQGNRVSDVGHYAALLDDHRRFMNLDSLVTDILKESPMKRLDESRMQSYSAGAAAPRAMFNVEAVEKLKNKMWPMLSEQGLQKVRQLEDDVIYVVCEMEKNGTLIDQELLEQWVKETLHQYHRTLMELYKLTGLKLNPSSSNDAAKLFNHLNIPITEFTDEGNASFTDATMKQQEHPTVKMFRHGKKLASLHSKFKKYQKCVSSDGVLRYALHQLRASKSDGEEGGESGTVVGRFTSTEIVQGVGINIQQVMKPEKQFLTIGDEFFIRELHIPQAGHMHLSADAEQIQYRLFAHEAQNKMVLEAYAADPWLSFHRLTLKLFREFKPDQPYKRQKDVNFAKMFVAGPSKLGLMMEFITKAQFIQLKAAKANRYHPLLATTLEILKIYDKMLPEVDILTKKSTALAETRGFIKSILGRRMRFPNGQRSHKALNGRIIMSEADIVKTKAVELHKARKDTGLLLRFQVHDEFDGDVPNEESAKKVGEILNIQSFKLTVPILWGVNTGTSWGNCAEGELNKMREEANL